MIKVLIVDDSVAVRGLMRKAITDTPGYEVVCGAQDGIYAVCEYQRLKPDIVIMDVEMPNKDGIEALREILAFDPTARIIMYATLNEQSRDLPAQLLEMGAIDFVEKPNAEKFFSEPETFTQELVAHMKAVTSAEILLSLYDIAPPEIVSQYNAPPIEDEKKEEGVKTEQEEGMITPFGDVAFEPLPYTIVHQKDCTTRPIPPDFIHADIICIGSSTGGVQALLQVVADMGLPNAPVLITQHMPPTFTEMLAMQIEERTALKAVEGKEGMKLEPNVAYIAPGGMHMEIVNREDALCIHLSNGPLENFCRPSVDPMVRSLLSAIKNKKILIVILTGMGNDGQPSARLAVEKGHLLVAQDEATSVVWGMPGAVAKEGLCHAILPVNEIGAWVKTFTRQ